MSGYFIQISEATTAKTIFYHSNYKHSDFELVFVTNRANTHSKSLLKVIWNVCIAHGLGLCV